VRGNVFERYLQSVTLRLESWPFLTYNINQLNRPFANSYYTVLYMINNSLFDELTKRLADLTPKGDRFRTKLHSKIDSTLRAGFSEFGVLTKQEFEAQTEALKRAEGRIEELEVQLEKLEHRVADLK
jgi:BMFP domain-containing protein YqiC